MPVIAGDRVMPLFMKGFWERDKEVRGGLGSLAGNRAFWDTYGDGGGCLEKLLFLEGIGSLWRLRGSISAMGGSMSSFEADSQG